LHKDHQFLLLLVNALQTDLRSDNFLEVSMALGALAKLVNTDITPAVLPLVVALLEHKQPVIRKKAVMCLHRFFQLDPAVLAPLGDKVKQALCDVDPSVMGATLILLRGLASADPSAYKDLVPSLVSILKQVIEHRLPRDFDYHRLPAPWIQLDLLRLLAVLGRNDKNASAHMQQVLADVIRRAAIGTNIGYAVVHECVRTATTIYPHGPLLEAAAQAVTHFLTSPNHNLKYLGVTALAAIVRVDARHAVAHQLTVVDCLEDPDETLRRRTLDLLCAMTNPENVVPVVAKLIGHLRATGDAFMRGALVQRIAALAEQFAPDAAWYVATMNDVLGAGGAHVPPSVAQGLLRLLSQPAELSEVDMDAVRQRTVDVYAGILRAGQPLPDLMVQTVAWTLGEYGELASEVPLDALVALLCGVAHRQFADGSVRYWLLAAVQALLARLPDHVPVPACVLPTLRACQCSRDLALQQKARECAALLDNRALLARAAPRDIFHARPRVDPAMGFLQPVVAAALASGAQQYHQASAGAAVREKKALRFDAYEKPEAPVLRAAGIDFLDKPADAPAASSSSTPAAAPETGLKLKAANKMWGPKGFNAKKPAPAPAPEPEPEPEQPQPQPQRAPSPAAAPAQPSPREAPVASPRFQPRQTALAAQQARGKTAAAQTLFAGVGGARAAPASSKAAGKPSLFAGIAMKPSANARAPAAPVAAPPAKPAASPAAAKPAAQPASLDILMASPASSAPADVLGDFFSFTPSATTPAAPAPASSSSAQSPLDFLNETPAPAPSQPVDMLSAFAALDVAAPAPAPGSSADADLLSMLAASAHDTIDAVDARMGLGIRDAPATDLPHAHAAQLSLQAWVRPAALASHVVVVATNLTSAPLTANLSLAVPDAHARTTPVDVRPNGRGYHALAAELAPQQAVAAVLAINMATQAAFPAPSCAVTLQAPAISASVSSSVPIPAHVLLRPLTLVTKHYAETWKALGVAGEVKSGVIPCRHHTSITNDDILALLRQLQLHAVQTIKQETIAASSLLGSNETLLVHVRIVDGGVTVQARCKHQAVSQGIVQSFQSLL
jgi:AP-4 complex subunit epsilon-1